MKHFLLAGIHPELSLAEAEAVLSSKIEHRIGPMFLIDRTGFDGATHQEKLAGIVKLGEVVAELPRQTVTELAQRLADIVESRPRAERVLFGFSLEGAAKETGLYKKLPIEFKRALQDRGRSVRWVTGDHGTISPAAVAKLKLTTEGYDFVIGMDGKTIVVGLTTHVQNADAWSLRDYGRPFRDAKTGMLPPKLARLMINLATGDQTPKSLLDPFCGGGTVLMEAALLFPEARLVGSDIDPAQIHGTKQNVDWLNEQGLISMSSLPHLIVSPAQDLPSRIDQPFDVIVTEGYLGEALRGHEPRTFLEKNREAVEAVWKEALPALAKLLISGGYLVCVWPEFVVGQDIVTTDATRAATQAGFRIVRSDLKYGRADQRVIRRIILLQKDSSRNIVSASTAKA